MADAFGPIAPAPAADTFVFDFTAQIGASGTITAVVWSCTVDPASPVADDNPGARLLNTPVYSGTRTSALIGNMVDGVLYDLEAGVTVSDGRVLTDTATLQCSSEQPVPDPHAPLTPDQFRMMFPAFSDSTVYTDVMIQMWINLCPIDPCIWDGLYQLGMGLWVGHELTKFGPNGLAATPGAPGVGIPQSKSVGSVSLSYDTQLGVDEKAGQYNMTLYGRQFWQLLKYLPIGPIQVGAASLPLTPVGGAWLGPWPFPGPGMSGFG